MTGSYKDICPDYDEALIWKKGKQVKICNYWNLDDHGLCKHENHMTCKIYLNKNNITDPWLIGFMDEFGCVLDDKFKSTWTQRPGKCPSKEDYDKI